MKTRLTTLMLAAAALLASCSQEDALQTTVNDNDGRKAVTVTATLPEGSMTTRAVNAQGNEEVNRCLIQIFEKVGTETQELQPTEGYETPQPMTGSEAGGFSTTAMLNPTKEYTILFWADEGEATYEASADLRNVKVADDAMPGIAYAGKTEWSSTSGAAVQAELKHAVAKVTLRSTTDVDAGKTVSVTVPAFYTAYDVSSNKVTGDAVQKEFTHTVSETITGKPQEGAEVFSFYALVQEETQNLTLNAEAAPVEIPNVPLAPNKHTILVGDVRNLGLEEVTFTATVDTNWGGTESVFIVPGDVVEITTENCSDINGEGNYVLRGTFGNSITVTGGSPTIYLDDASISVSSGNAINITGGTPTIYVVGENNSVSSSNGAGIYVAQGSTVTVTSTSRDNILTARGGNGGSGIGAGSDTSCGNIEISNVTIYAYGNSGMQKAYSAGIGGSGCNACGTITIDNAIIYAYGTNDGAAGNMSTPGIGGGLDRDSKGTYDTITIKNNSQVSVQRGSQRSDYIGSGGSTKNPAISSDGIDATIDESSAVTKLN